MRILIANLKLFYQRRVFWLAYLGLFTGSFVCWTFMRLGRPGTGRATSVVPLGVLMLVLAAGSLVGNMRRDLTSRTACAQLPGHRVLWRRFTFLVGLVVAGAGSFVFVRYMDGESISSRAFAQALFTAFGANLTVYLVGVCSAFGRSAVPTGCTVIIFLFTFLGLYGRVEAQSCVALTRAVIGSPVPIALLSATTATLAWLWLGRRTYQRDSREARRRGSAHSARAEFCLARTYRSAYLAPAKYVWGMLHVMSLSGNPWRVRTRSVVLSGVLCVVFGAYLGTREPVYMFAILFAIVISYDEYHPLHGDMLPGAGREQRFFATMASLTVITFTTVLAIGVPIAISDLLAPLLPEFQVAGLKIGYAPMSLWLVMLPVIAVPVGSLCNMAFERGSCEHLFSIVLVLAAVLIAGQVVCSWMTPVPLFYVVLITALPWGLCALGFRRIAMQNDLVAPRRRRS